MIEVWQGRPTAVAIARSEYGYRDAGIPSILTQRSSASRLAERNEKIVDNSDFLTVVITDFHGFLQPRFERSLLR